MELEELEPSKLIGPQQDVETVESWADTAVRQAQVSAWLLAYACLQVLDGERLKPWCLSECVMAW